MPWINQRHPCDWTQSLNTSVEVDTATKNLLGFDTSTLNLTFGKFSPGNGVKRFIIVNSSTAAEVSVNVHSVFSSWIQIDPERFSLVPAESKTVSFSLSVPPWAQPGKYTGTAEFCFRRT